jgi:hypothetical protein
METNKKLKNTREVYEAPIMETVEVRGEQGFQMSVAPSSTFDPLKEIVR